MSLDSTENLSAAHGGKHCNEPTNKPDGPEVENCPSPNGDTSSLSPISTTEHTAITRKGTSELSGEGNSITPAEASTSGESNHPAGEDTSATSATTWSYLFLHHTRVDRVAAVLSEHFTTYVHTTVTYLRKRKRVVEEKRPTVSGLLFVKGTPQAIGVHLNEHFPGLYLARNCATGRTAVIPDSQMQTFMRISSLDPQRIRFLPHELHHYASGHQPVRIVGGLLDGVEGYVIRIARNRRLVMAVGCFTLAIDGIHNEQMENIPPYMARPEAGTGAALPAPRPEHGDE